MNSGKGKAYYFKSIVVIAAILTVWVVVTRMGVFSAYVFPGPERVLKAFVSMAGKGEITRNLIVSLIRVLVGFSISFVLAFSFAVLATRFPKADPFYKPILEFIRQVPPMSLIPLLILWFGIGETSKIIVIVLTSFFPIFMNAESGLKGCDPKLLEVGKMMKMSEFDSYVKIRIPYALPEILVGMRVGLGYSFRAIIGAEMIAAASGIGYMILDAQAMSRTDKVIVGIILIGLLGFAVDMVFRLLMGKNSIKWQQTK